MAREAAARSIFALSAEIGHGLGRLADSDGYEDSVRTNVRDIRRLGREHETLLGPGVRDAVTAYTDRVLSELPQISAGAAPSDALSGRATFLAGTLVGSVPGWTLEA